MFSHTRSIVPAIFSIVIGMCLLSCKKMVTVPQPINSITTSQIFSSDAQAAMAMAGVYSTMINSSLNFSNGFTTFLGGLSADEFFYNGTSDPGMTAFYTNQLLYSNGYSGTVWINAYKTIYNVNAVIEGIAASTSDLLTDTTRTRLTAEAKFVRALCFFYLTNLFGDVPLALTIDFNKTRYLTRTPASRVYEQIIQDLEEARSVLSPDYTTSANERILPNKWAATALQARAYLFTGDYANAAARATEVISNNSMYSLETDPNKVFLISSKEAIWQLKQITTDNTFKNGTAEGFNCIPLPAANQVPRYCLTASLLNAFEPGDKRRAAWVSSKTVGTTYYFPYKYKLGSTNAASGTPSSEYYMVLRLAEMYLVRAEAAVNGAPGGTAAAITDLNVIRTRAGLPVLPAGLTADQVKAAVAKERQIELFAEWGHRWLDLKRTNKAHDVLSAISAKQPWTGDYQLLYPIPPSEIQVNPQLEQNPEY